MAGIGNWTLDISTGVLKNNALSRELLVASYEKTRAMDTVKTYPFGKGRGQSLTIPRLVANQLGTATFGTGTAATVEPADASLTELGGIPEDSFSITEATITVSEYGRTFPYTSLQQDLLAFDLENELQDLLRSQMALVLDTLAITAHKQAKVYYAATAAGTRTISTNGAPGATAAVDLNPWHVEEIALYLAEALLAPPYEADDYLGLCRYKSLLAIRRDTDWEMWHSYTQPEAKFNGEVGRYERTRFVETNHWAALLDCGTNGIAGQAIFMGQTPVGMVEAVSPELRAGIPTDLGRKKLVGWYGVLGFKELWGTANPRQARSVVVSSQ